MRNDMRGASRCTSRIDQVSCHGVGDPHGNQDRTHLFMVS